jgi:uncharacterized protein YjbI with pentapeptide repeats
MAKLRHVFQSIGIAVLITVFVILVILVLWLVEEQVVWLWNAKSVNAKDLFKAKNDALATFAQILGGFAILIGVYFAWRNIAATNKNIELTNQNLELTKEGQVTERFTKAIEQLGATDDKGNAKLELRLGGIYALERISRDSEKDHWPIMDVLTAYLRANARATNHLATDIQAILMVIRRRECRYEKTVSGYPLQGRKLQILAYLDRHHLDLRGAYLDGADLKEAHLEGTHLEDAVLTNAHLIAAHLEYARLTNADLRKAGLMAANLEGASLVRTDLTGASLTGAHLEGTSLREADLSEAHMYAAHLEGDRCDGSDPAASRFSHWRHPHQAAPGHRHARILEEEVESVAPGIALLSLDSLSIVLSEVGKSNSLSTCHDLPSPYPALLPARRERRKARTA